jgi:hypothetical protein
MSARIILRDSTELVANRLLEVTQVGSLTELASLMFSRYGSHLEQTWQVMPIGPSYAQIEPPPAPVERPTNFSFDEPLEGL